MLTILNCVRQDCEGICHCVGKVLSLCVFEVELGQQIATNTHLFTCFCASREHYPFKQTFSCSVCLADLVALPITSWLPCDLVVKLFGDYVATTFHQADRSSQTGFLFMQLQGRICVDFWQVLPLLPETESSSCCQSPKSKNCTPSDCSEYWLPGFISLCYVQSCITAFNCSSVWHKVSECLQIQMYIPKYVAWLKLKQSTVNELHDAPNERWEQMQSCLLTLLTRMPS